MSTVGDIFTAVEIGGRLLPSLISTIGAALELGKSPAEAEALVKKDLTSRREAYEAQKAADDQALRDKHSGG